jgi:hypothetical protein
MAIVESDGTLENRVETADGPQVGEKAPDFVVETPSGRSLMSELAAQAGKVVLISQDSYQFHPG